MLQKIDLWKHPQGQISLHFEYKFVMIIYLLHTNNIMHVTLQYLYIVESSLSHLFLVHGLVVLFLLATFVARYSDFCQADAQKLTCTGTSRSQNLSLFCTKIRQL